MKEILSFKGSATEQNVGTAMHVTYPYVLYAVSSE